jgi:hypothetical protein
MEIWVPAPDGAHVDIDDGVYLDLDYFSAVSRNLRYKRGEGLPGRAWEHGVPVIIPDLAHTYYSRAEAAAHVGLTCAVAVPAFANGALHSVTAFFCGDDPARSGALEIWRLAEGDDFLTLADGYFCNADAFEALARDTTFASGKGLPGAVWKCGRPLIWSDLQSDPRFLRREEAIRAGITRGVGIPIPVRDGSVCVMLFLSASRSPIAGRTEIWMRGGDGLFRFADGYCESGADPAAEHGDTAIAEGEGSIGAAVAEGMPTIMRDLAICGDTYAAYAARAGNRSALIMPVAGSNGIASVLVFYV